MRFTTLRAWRQRHRNAVRWLGIGAAILCLALGVLLYVAAEDRVCLVADGRAAILKTRAADVSGFLRKAGVVLHPEDVIEPAGSTPIKEGMTIRVHRAFPVELIVAGQRRRVNTIARPVREILRLCRVTLGENDRILPDLGQEVKPGQTIRVIRVSTRQLTYREEVSQDVIRRKDPNLDQGKTRTIKPGAPGLVERTALVRYEDGRESGRQILQSKWLRWPIAGIVAIGIKPLVYSFITSRGQVVRYTKTMTMTATAYYPGPESCGPNAKGITRTGARATYGVVAVDPRVIRLGTRLYVEGYGFATALDTGSAIKGNKIDLCYDTYREALYYGKKKIKIYILAEQ